MYRTWQKCLRNDASLASEILPNEISKNGWKGMSNRGTLQKYPVTPIAKANHWTCLTLRYEALGSKRNLILP